MFYKLCCLFLLFFIYAFLGYIIESTCVSVDYKKLTFSRGFLIGPYLPIFGFGGLLMSLFLEKYASDLIVLFIMSITICLTLEYLTSYFLEKIFKLRWWDYSEKKFNLNGRICLDVGIMFGLGGVIAIKFINPIIYKLFKITPNIVLIIIAIVLFIIIISDLIVSTRTVFKFKDSFTRYAVDSTTEVKNKIISELGKEHFFTNRLLKSFPNAKDRANKYKELREKIIKYRNERRKNK